MQKTGTAIELIFIFFPLARDVAKKSQKFSVEHTCKMFFAIILPIFILPRAEYPKQKHIIILLLMLKLLRLKHCVMADSRRRDV